MGLKEWAVYGGTLTAKIGGKIVLNACVPGLGAAVEFGFAVYHFVDGDVLGGVINVISGIDDLCTCGLVGAIKDAMKEGAKGAAVQSAKDSAKSAGKEATRKVGQDLAKKIAMGTTEGGIDAAAAIKTAKAVAASAYKEATRKVGQQFGKEFAKGVTTEAAEEVWQAGTRMTFKKFLQSAGSAAISSGGNQVLKTTLEDLTESMAHKLFFESLKQQPKAFVFELTKEAAKKGAEEELMKHSYKFIAKDVGVSFFKGAIRASQDRKQN